MLDLDTRRRESVTHVLRPDSLSPRGLPSGTRAVRPDDDATAVEHAIERLGRAGALDEFVPDTLDGLVAAWQRLWDAHVDEQVHEQVLTSLRLAGQELENVVACLARVQALRAELADLDDEVSNWRGVLRGEITALPFPTTATARPQVGDADLLRGLLADALLGTWGRDALAPASEEMVDDDSAAPVVPAPRALPDLDRDHNHDHDFTLTTHHEERA